MNHASPTSPNYAGAYVDTDEPPCPTCGLSHKPERRHRILRRMLPATSAEITDAYSHLWPNKDGRGNRMLNRDLHAVGAKPDAFGIWRLK